MTNKVGGQTAKVKDVLWKLFPISLGAPSTLDASMVVAPVPISEYLQNDRKILVTLKAKIVNSFYTNDEK